MTKLPQSVAEIARVIGRDQALYLVGQLPPCGSRPWRRVLYVPATMAPDHWLVRVLGWHDATKLSREYRGMWITLSTCSHIIGAHRARAIHEAYACGTPVHVIAALFDLTARSVARILEATPEDAAAARRQSPRLSTRDQDRP